MSESLLSSPLRRSLKQTNLKLKLKLAAICVLLSSGCAAINVIQLRSSNTNRKVNSTDHHDLHGGHDPTPEHSTKHATLKIKASQSSEAKHVASVARHLEAVPGAVHHRGSNSGTNTSQVSDKASDTTAAEDVAEDSSEDGPDESTVLLKSRLLPTDVFGKGSPTLRKREEGQPHTNVNITAHPPARSGVLDIVITHFDAENVNQMIDYWLNFLQSKKVQEMKPYVYLYCQNEEYDMNEETFQAMLQLGGQVIHAPNVGRESHGFLGHIIDHYDDLAQHTLFAQDLSSPDLPNKMEMLFENSTGFLPLSFVGHVACDDPWLPNGIISQIYSMLADEICPPVGYTSSFEGQFIVSRRRVLERPKWMYQRLLDMLVADEGHWIHRTHNHDEYKTKDNPMFGHVLERTWSLAFNCFESWRERNCGMCMRKGMWGCGPGDCQCFDGR